MNLISYVKPRIQRRVARIIEIPLARAYNRQPQAVPSKPEPANEEIIKSGLHLKEAVLQTYQQRFQHTNYRFLFQMPNHGVGTIWFHDLIQCMNHMGLATQTISINDPDFYQIWEAFKPNVFISMDSLPVLKSLDLDFINQYKKQSGLLRLFTPINPYRFPKPGLSADDHWRLSLARAGKSVDAYFSMMSDSFFEHFSAEWHQAGFRYLALPFACNPIIHFPRNEEKIYDYFMVTSFGYDRALLTYQYLLPIFKTYTGLWAGTDWKFGIGPIDPKEVPKFRARAKIVLNPLQYYNRTYPADLTERAFSATACGAFQITDHTPITDQFFAADELVCVRSPEEFQQKFDYYLQRPDERNKIALKGMLRVFYEHTYFHRIEKLLAFLDSL